MRLNLRKRTAARRVQSAAMLAQVLEDRRVLAVTVGFEDLGAGLADESFFNGPDPNGTSQPGDFGSTVVTGEFESQGAIFNNVHNQFPDFSTWSGWSYSNVTDNTTAGFGNQYSAFAGGGASGSTTYGVGFGDATIQLPSSPADLQFDSIMITNTTYAALSMRDGDSFAKQFGGSTGNDPDFYLLTIGGLDASGESVGTVEFYLADYQFADNSLDYIVDTWIEVDISSLSAAETLSFGVTSSDNGDFGINTPAYFAVDEIKLAEPVVVEPQLTVDIAADSISEDAGSTATTVTLTRNTDTTSPLTVNLTNSDSTTLGVPTTATFDTGESTLTLDVAALNDSIAEASLNASITASATGFISGSDTVEVIDDDTLLALAGGPYEIAEGDSLTLQGSVSGGIEPSYAWDLNHDGIFTDASGANPTLSWSQLVALGIDNGSAAGTSFTVTLQATSNGFTASDTAELTLDNTAPTASIVGADSTMLGDTVTFTVSASDPSPVDAAGTFSYQINWGEGSDPLQVTGPASGVTVSHVFTQPGGFTVSATAQDPDGAPSNPATGAITVQSIVQENDDLVITGSSSSDRFVVFPSNVGVSVRMNNLTLPITLGDANRIVINGGGGNDFMVVAGGLLMPVVFNGGAGNDYLAGGGLDDTLVGGEGNDVLLAGEGDNFVEGGLGNDRIEGRTGVDTLFGGAGNDRINGGHGNDLLAGNDGNDSLFGHLGHDLLVGGAGFDNLAGHYGNDLTLGGSGNDQLFGGGDHDLLIGGTGADRARGDSGDDTLVGGSSTLEAALDQALADLGTEGTPLPVAIESALDSWFTGTDASGLAPWLGDSEVDYLRGDTGVNEVIRN